MFKNKKMSTLITIAVSAVTAICIAGLFLVANYNMTTAMKKTAMNNMKTSLEARERIVDQYVRDSETILISYSQAPIIADLLKNPKDKAIQQRAQQYTESYFKKLTQWEGVYTSRWEDTYVLAHSNPKVVGITTRKGDALKALQNSMKEAKDIYNTVNKILDFKPKQFTEISKNAITTAKMFSYENSIKNYLQKIELFKL